MLDEEAFSESVERKLEAPMPWIGMYVAAASLACTLAMAADALHAFRAMKFWFPTKFFSLNAMSLTLLTVAMKLPVDLTTRMYAPTDRLAKICTQAFMSTAIANFMTCLGSMDDRDILTNTCALFVLVLTVLANVCVQIIQMRELLRARKMFVEEIISCLLMLVSLVLVGSTAVMVPSMKSSLESKYHEMLKMASNEEELAVLGKLPVTIKKYQVMAQTSSPQFVIARSATCTASGVVSLLTCLVLAEAEARVAMECGIFKNGPSKYRWSVKWILLAQTVGVVVGTVGPAFRLLTAVKFKFSEIVINGGSQLFKDEFKVEAYWTQKLVEWKERSLLPLHIRDRKWRKLLHRAKRLILSLLIKIQISIVFCCKGVRFVSFCLASPVERLKNSLDFSSSSRVHGEWETQPEPDFSRYVLLLEGESELPRNIQIDICNEVDKLIEIGKKQRPANLISLLQKIGNFKGLKEVDRNEVPSLHTQEPHKCWSLPLVTLTSIAISLPKIPKQKTDWLLRSVDEGLVYVKLIEKSLDKKGNLLNNRNAADVIWVGVELYRKWQGKDIHKTSLKCRDSKETLEELSQNAEKDISDFKTEVNDFLMENPVNWPVKIVAANSMYRICRRLLIAYEGDFLKADEGLFDQICNMIANIMAACLTNLMRVIIEKCQHKAIKEKEKIVRKAALLLGETEEILRVIQQHRETRTDPDESEFIEKWCNLVKRRS
ncbi:Unknown protein [Striga hermonthica]|uniref:Uncharacterized protein n=1 Tax=Striga hermonthica TaxID=68872 RepID=A0A9N7NA27_STRHE|nr:Unknown protein [Striga hermonthica]